MSNYTAKQALARLIAFLQETQKPEVKRILAAAPAEGNVVGRGTGLLVSSWVILFTDRNDRSLQAKVDSSGTVTVNEGPPSPQESVAPANHWLLDNTDAIEIALNNKAGWYAQSPTGGQLVAVLVKGRGSHLVWNGEGFIQNKSGLQAISIDAETGEIYLMTEKEEYVPATPAESSAGPFKSRTAPRSSKNTYWPVAYEKPSGQVVYNRRLLTEELVREKNLSSRDSASWERSGIIAACLNDWTAAVADLSRALQLRSEDGYKYEKAVLELAVRDFKRASKDLSGIAASTSQADRAKRIMGELRGTSPIPQSGCTYISSVELRPGKLPFVLCTGAIALEYLAK